MKRKLEGVLDTVKEPETQLSIAELGLVEKISYSAEHKKLRVFLNDVNGNPHGCCTIIGSLLLSTTLDNLTEELQKEFPDLSFEIV